MKDDTNYKTKQDGFNIINKEKIYEWFVHFKLMKHEAGRDSDIEVLGCGH